MSYLESPMTEYNKSNPLVMLSEKEYAGLINDLQSCSRRVVRMLILLSAYLIFFIAAIVFGVFSRNHQIIQLFIFNMVVVLFFDIFYFLYYRRSANHYMHEHSGMKKFERISNLKHNEILKIGNEDLLDCLHGLYELKGELTIIIGNIRLLGLALGIIEAGMIIGSIIVYIMEVLLGG